MRTGGCLCGEVRYELDGTLEPVVACHCSQCRRTSGHFAAFASAERARVAVTGEVAWFFSTPGEVRRGFCAACGSTLFWDRIGGDKLDIAAGTLDSPTGLETACHIYVADKSDYYEIADGLPQHPAWYP